MALNRKNINFIAANTLPLFANWETVEGGASVLVDTATLPPLSYIEHSLNADYNEALSAAQYRRLTLTMKTKPGEKANYTNIDQLVVELHIIYGVDAVNEMDEQEVVIAMNDDDIVTNSNQTFTLSRVIETDSKLMQECVITVKNLGKDTIEISDIKLQRSSDINMGQLSTVINGLNSEKAIKSFKVYDKDSNNMITGLGAIIAKGLELKWKPVYEGNQVSQIDTNFQDPIPVVYVYEDIDLTTSDDGSSEEES